MPRPARYTLVAALLMLAADAALVYIAPGSARPGLAIALAFGDALAIGLLFALDSRRTAATAGPPADPEAPAAAAAYVLAVLAAMPETTAVRLQAAYLAASDSPEYRASEGRLLEAARGAGLWTSLRDQLLVHARLNGAAAAAGLVAATGPYASPLDAARIAGPWLSAGLPLLMADGAALVPYGADSPALPAASVAGLATVATIARNLDDAETERLHAAAHLLNGATDTLKAIHVNDYLHSSLRAEHTLDGSGRRRAVGFDALTSRLPRAAVDAATAVLVADLLTTGDDFERLTAAWQECDLPLLDASWVPDYAETPADARSLD